jgi:2-polyprenyl-3-methyl-5-hydroxy-6-metoxy-1,4-benzoquinol methylase
MEPCNCDLCGSAEYRSLPHFMTGELPVVICSRCGLTFTNPRWTREEMAEILEEEFRDDPGAPSVQTENYQAMRESRFDAATRSLEAKLLPRIKSIVAPRGKRWLDVRFRNGALIAALLREGADVTGVDPFPRNVEWVGNRTRCTQLHAVPHDDLLRGVEGPFDVISMVSVHVAAHVPSPTQLFREVYERLAPGGLLILDEKDITRIPRGVTVFPLRYPFGMAHYHHLTVNSTQSFLKKAGFDLQMVEWSKDESLLKHFLIVARKPLAPQPSPREVRGDDPRKLRLRLHYLFFRTVLASKRAGLARRLRKVFQSS